MTPTKAESRGRAPKSLLRTRKGPSRSGRAGGVRLRPDFEPLEGRTLLHAGHVHSDLLFSPISEEPQRWQR